MYLAVKQFLTDDKDVTRDIPHFSETFRSFCEVVDCIDAASEGQLKSRKGIAQVKKALQDKLVTITCDYSNKLRYFAQMTSDIILEEEVRLSKSAIEDMRDNSLLAYSESVYHRAVSFHADLLKVLITKETNTAFRKAIDEFSESIDKPRLGIVERKQATMNLIRLFDEGNEMISQIDTLLGIIKIKEPLFHGNYSDVRKIVQGNAGPLSLRVRVADAATGSPVGGARILCVPVSDKTDRGKKIKAIERASGAGGGIAIKNMKQGKYRILVIKSGYIPKETIVTVTKNERKDVLMELEKR